jgi:NAD(P)-dependent dehydrogenase (short-subunit alcohol dehydrogenase family)
VREGWRVVLLARSVEYIESLAAELNGNHQCDTVRAIRCDLAHPTQISAAFSEIRKEVGPVDLLVNHASGSGGPRGSSLIDLDPAIFEQAWRVASMEHCFARVKPHVTARCCERTIHFYRRHLVGKRSAYRVL